MTSVADQLLTADDLLALPGDPSGGKMELVEGRLVTMSPVGEEHGDEVVVLLTELRSFARRHRLGKTWTEVGFILKHDPDTVRGPDVSFLRVSDQPEGRNRRRFLDCAPTLAVEVVSPHERERDLLTKVGEYLDAGAARVWVVRPEQQTVTVFAPGGVITVKHAGDALESDDAAFDVPGFSLPVAEIFESDG